MEAGAEEMNKFKHRGITFEDHIYGVCVCDSCPKNYVSSSEYSTGSVVWMRDSSGGLYQSYGHWISRDAACDLLISRYHISPRPNARWVGNLYDNG